MRLVPFRCATNPDLHALLDSKGLTVDDEWVLDSSLVWLLMDDAGAVSTETLTVPVGFITDLASIPAFLRGILSPTGKSRRAAIAHDYLYSSQLWSRSDADEFLRLALIREGVSPGVARIYWLGVHAFGWRYYGQRKAGLTGDDFVDSVS